MKNFKEKICSSCKKSKLLCEFNKNKSKKDNLATECKTCCAAYNKQYRAQNKDAIVLKKKQYSEKNKEKIAEYRKQYQVENKEKIAEYRKQYREINKDSLLLKKKQYRENKTNNRIYIGCTTQLERRWREHKGSLERGRHENGLLQKDYNKYGKDAFVYSILKEHRKDIQFQDLEKEETKLILGKKQNGEKLYNISVKISSIEI